jgi:hypothetical protein
MFVYHIWCGFRNVGSQVHSHTPDRPGRLRCIQSPSKVQHARWKWMQFEFVRVSDAGTLWLPLLFWLDTGSYSCRQTLRSVPTRTPSLFTTVILFRCALQKMPSRRPALEGALLSPKCSDSVRNDVFLLKSRPNRYHVHATGHIVTLQRGRKHYWWTHMLFDHVTLKKSDHPPRSYWIEDV